SGAPLRWARGRDGSGAHSHHPAGGGPEGRAQVDRGEHACHSARFMRQGRRRAAVVHHVDGGGALRGGARHRIVSVRNFFTTAFVRVAEIFSMSSPSSAAARPGGEANEPTTGGTT